MFSSSKKHHSSNPNHNVITINSIDAVLLDNIAKLAWDVAAGDQKKLVEMEKRNETLHRRAAEANKAYLQEITMLRDQARPRHRRALNKLSHKKK